MARLSKAEIERTLLSGGLLEWVDSNGKRSVLQLTNAKERRLFAYLLTSEVRQPTGLTEPFIAGLAAAFDGSNDPASGLQSENTHSSPTGPWKLYSIETEGFGGLNTWGGSAFRMEVDGDSFILDGPNGSGKSSLVGAITWALAGERPRDQSDASGHEAKPVFGENNKIAGQWPPLGCYPPTLGQLKQLPDVKVRLTFSHSSSGRATVERALSQGIVTQTVSPNFYVPPVLIETGILMPARMAHLRFDDGGGRLTDAIQQLTGLDDLVAIGALTDGLCYKSREYRAYRSKELVNFTTQFDQAIARARSELHSVSIEVPPFKPGDTDNPNGAMAALGTTLTDLATASAQVISSDLNTGLDVALIRVQNEVIANIAAARDEIGAGIEALIQWKSIHGVATSIDQETAREIREATEDALLQAADAVDLLKRSRDDSRFQLKALGAKWHADHASGPIENCPLCQHSLRNNPELIRELEELRVAGDAATKKFDDNINSIVATLDQVIPKELRYTKSESISAEPRGQLISQIQATFVDKERYANCLVTVAELVRRALATAPPATLGVPTEESLISDDPDLARIMDRIAFARRLIALAEWFQSNSESWRLWWATLAGSKNEEINSPFAVMREAQGSKESLVRHLDRLSESLEKSEPYRKGAEALREAWKAGRNASEIEKEVDKRNAISESLQPLKSLVVLCESIARVACTRFHGHRVRCFDGTGGVSWRGGSLHASSSLRLCG